MKKPQKPPSYLYPTLMVLGMGIAYGSLLVNQQFQFTLSVASLLSPMGARVTVGGFRIKHWVVGVLIGFGGVIGYFTEEKHTITKQVGMLMVGAGILLVLDEYEAVIKTITTGQYP